MPPDKLTQALPTGTIFFCIMTSVQTNLMDFSTELLSSGYTYDKWVGCFMKEESNGDLHTFMNVEGNEWIYEKYDSCDRELASVAFVI